MDLEEPWICFTELVACAQMFGWSVVPETADEICQFLMEAFVEFEIQAVGTIAYQ